MTASLILLAYLMGRTILVVGMLPLDEEKFGAAIDLLVEFCVLLFQG